MRKRILSYRRRIDSVLEQGGEGINEELLREHLQQIAFFSHERLVHLIVTMTVALLTMISIAASVVTGELFFSLTSVLLVMLFIPYIFHYFLLENEVQRMYVQYDRILEVCRKAGGQKVTEKDGA